MPFNRDVISKENYEPMALRCWQTSLSKPASNSDCAVTQVLPIPKASTTGPATSKVVCIPGTSTADPATSEIVCIPGPSVAGPSMSEAIHFPTSLTLQHRDKVRFSHLNQHQSRDGLQYVALLLKLTSKY